MIFDPLDTFAKFEQFCRKLLNAHCAEKVPFRWGANGESMELRESVHDYGKKGDDQRGIDLGGYWTTGEEVAFQCKHWEARITKGDAQKIISTAEKKYPEASNYYCLAWGGFKPRAIDEFKAAGWSHWDKEQMLDMLGNLPIAKAKQIAEVCFDVGQAEKFFPFGPNLLLTPQDYRERYLEDFLGHKYQCLGREREIKKIAKELERGSNKAVFLVGEGGVGKSRVFQEVLERLSEKREVRIFQAGAEGSAKEVGMIDGEELILGMDEAHLEGYFHDGLAKALREHHPKGTLLISCRPVGLEQLRGELVRQGWEVEFPYRERFPAMTKSGMEALAQEVLGEGREREASLLAKASEGNVLFTVAGGQMACEAKEDIVEVLRGDGFKERVFVHLEDRYLEKLGEGEKFESKRLLRLLALISPWTKDLEEKICEVLELTRSDYCRALLQLKLAGLVRDQEGVARVIPDLFSDHLVRQALRAEDELGIWEEVRDSELLFAEGATVFRNLALARSLGGEEFSHLDPIIESLWKRFAEQFKEGFDDKRRALVGAWSECALSLPAKTLVLCELVFGSDPNPESNEFFPLDPEVVEWQHQDLKKEALRMLTGVAKYREDFQEEALELLWRNRGLVDSNENGDSFGMRDLLGFGYYRSISSTAKALGWLIGEFEAGRLENWTEERTLDVSYFLEPTFQLFREREECSVNHMTVHWRENWEPEAVTIREKGLAFLEELGKASVFGALNVTQLLASVLGFPVLPRSFEPTGKWVDKWEPLSREALGILDRLTDIHDDRALDYLVRKYALMAIGDERLPNAIREGCRELSEKLTKREGMETAIALLNHSWDEYRSVEERDDAPTIWYERMGKLGRALKDQFSSVHELVDELEAQFTEFERKGYQPHLSEVLLGLKEVFPEVLEEARARALGPEESIWSGSFVHLSAWLGEEGYEERLVKGCRTDRPAVLNDLWSRLDWDLRLKPGTLLKVKEAFVKMVQNCEDQQANSLLEMALKHGKENAMTLLALGNLNWGLIDKDVLPKVEETYFGYHGFGRGFPKEAYRGILKRISDFELDFIGEVSGLVGEACRQEELSAFDFFEKRIARSAAGEVGAVFPYLQDGFGFETTETILRYEKKAKQIFEAFRGKPDNLQRRQWFEIAVFNSSSLGIKWLLEWVEEEDDQELIVDIAGLLSQRYRALTNPEMVSRLLKKAAGISGEFERKLRDNPLFSVKNHGQSYSNGIPQNRIYLDEARKQRERHRKDIRLFQFYDKIVKHEESDEEKHRTSWEREKEEMNEFC